MKIFPEINNLPRDEITLKVHPTITGILGYNHYKEIYGIVREDLYEAWEYNVPCDIVEFFGYKEQCSNNLKNYSGCIMISNLYDKLINFYNN